jgi:glycosyltransferase involved in cell wall biosynthesis
VPAEEERHGIRVLHPRYLVIPKVGMPLTPFFLAVAVWRGVRKIRREGDEHDVVDAHYFYPDGVAVALLSKVLRKPFLITARGSDINLLPQFAIPRRLIRWAAARASALVTVSDALRTGLLKLGVDDDKVHVVRNGVDLELFAPRDRARCKSRLGVGAMTLLSVGNLVALKGHDLVIRALPMLPGYELLVVGEGELRASLEALADALRVADRVRFLGAVQQSELVDLYNAADALVLASSREGMPNVVLEAMACGTPVVATAVGGVPEVVQGAAAGVLVEERDPGAIAAGIRRLFDPYPDRSATRRIAESFSWSNAVASLDRLYREVQEQRG